MANAVHVLGVVAALCGTAGCGALGRGDVVPPPITPVQKATASADNPDSAVLADFNDRVAKYVALQRGLAGKSSPQLKETANPAEITAARDVLAAKIASVRGDARQGDIFTPEVAGLFRRLMYPELQGTDGQNTRGNIQDETASVRLQVNASYPATQPLPTVPPNILASLPLLPPDLEYRIVGRDLILRDVDANIIVDYIPKAIR